VVGSSTSRWAGWLGGLGGGGGFLWIHFGAGEAAFA
jgi:hypothetical protein